MPRAGRPVTQVTQIVLGLLSNPTAPSPTHARAGKKRRLSGDRQLTIMHRLASTNRPEEPPGGMDEAQSDRTEVPDS
jgi:hypothetical protein